MTHDKLLAKVDALEARYTDYPTYLALRAVVELHKPEQLDEDEFACLGCRIGTSQFGYPCPTIQAIEKELQ